jgi:serine/threonine-protein kinase
MAQAADAIGAAHRAGIVHRDVKPANLLVTPDRNIKITDFGIARASDGLGLTGTGQVMGTPQYLSPEQARGGTASPASDVYSLGVVAFECLAGHRPFDAESPVATALAHLNDPVPDLPPGVPADLAGVVRRAMSKEPAQRYADGDALAAALRDPVAAAQTAYVPPVPPPDADAERTAVIGAVPPPPPPAPDPTPTPGAAPLDDSEPAADRRSPWPVVLLVLALAAAIVFVVVMVVRADDGEDDPAANDPSSTPPTTSAPTTEDTTPSQESSSAPAEVTIDEDDYIGRDVDAVAAELRDKGLRVETQPIENPGEKEPETVAGISPTSGLRVGDTVTVEYYREAEPTSPPPSSDTTSPPPTDPTSPTGPTGQTSPTGPTSPAATTSGSTATASGSPSASASLSGSAAAAPASATRTRGAR